MAKNGQLSGSSEDETSFDPVVDMKSVKDLLSFFLTVFRSKFDSNKTNTQQPFDYDLFLNNFKWIINSKVDNQNKIAQSMNFVVEQGLLKPLLPYLKTMLKFRKSLLPQSTSNSILQDIKFRFPERSNLAMSTLAIAPKKIGTEDPLLVIHVCEEVKGIWQDFQCHQSILLAGMGYFSRVAVKGQSLLNMDISVHCEIFIFQWLLDWILPTTNQKEKIKEIDAVNVIGLVVSAEFLQIPTLTTICLHYIIENIENVVIYSPNLQCLSDSLLSRICHYFQTGDIERRIAPEDKSDRITSRLYLHFIVNMNSREGSCNKGQTATTSTLFKCRHCNQLLTNDVAASTPCREIKTDSFGYQYSIHVKDSNWLLLNFVRNLKRELKTWRRVYWRLWGIVHFFFCLTCHFFYPARFKRHCKFHSSEKNLQREQESMEMRIAAQYYRHYGRKPFEFPAETELELEKEANLYSKKYTCCNVPFYNFAPKTIPQGCRTKNHVPDLSQKGALTKLETLEAFEDFIVQEDELDILKHLGKLRQSDCPISKTVVEEYLRRSPSLGSSSIQEDEWSSPERDLEDTSVQGLLSQYGFGLEVTAPSQGVNDLWIWNLDFSTRYNQDMQRELEEKCMIKLAFLS